MNEVYNVHGQITSAEYNITDGYHRLEISRMETI